MKLTKKQIEALELLHEKKTLPLSGCEVHKNVMNSLYFKNMVKINRCANGEFWQLTDSGIEIIMLKTQEL